MNLFRFTTELFPRIIPSIFESFNLEEIERIFCNCEKFKIVMTLDDYSEYTHYLYARPENYIGYDILTQYLDTFEDRESESLKYKIKKDLSISFKKDDDKIIEIIFDIHRKLCLLKFKNRINIDLYMTRDINDFILSDEDILENTLRSKHSLDNGCFDTILQGITDEQR